jgi:hypothetical protein
MLIELAFERREKNIRQATYEVKQKKTAISTYTDSPSTRFPFLSDVLLLFSYASLYESA